MKRLITLSTILCFAFLWVRANNECGCSPSVTEESLDNKLYTGENYVFFTGEVISVESAFHLEVIIQVEEIFYGKTYIKDISKPITVYFDLRSTCAVVETGDIKAGNKLFVTSIYNSMGRMLITNNCDAFFPEELIDTYKLRDFLNYLKELG